MATRFKSPVYAELSLYVVPKAGQPPVKIRAHRGYFDVEDAHLKAFKKTIADRPQYRIEEVGEAPTEEPTSPTEVHGKVKQAPGVTDAERHPEIAIPTETEVEAMPEPTDDDPDAAEAAIEAADDEADAEDDEDDDIGNTMEGEPEDDED